MVTSTNCSLAENLDGSRYPKMNIVHGLIQNPVKWPDSIINCQNKKALKKNTKIENEKNQTKIENEKNQTKIENENAIVLGCGIESTGGVNQH